jgi:hypothetical protein
MMVLGDEDPQTMTPISTTQQLTGVGAESWYALVVTDQLGCMGTKAFTLEKPGEGAEPAWRLGGNTGLNNWLGTNDNTDLVLKANNQPQLRLGADGVTEVLSPIRLSTLDDVDPSTVNNVKLLLLGPDGSVARTSNDPDYPYYPIQPNPCRQLSNGSIVPYWDNGIGKIFTACEPVNVGIGTDNPLAKLDVKGQMYSHRLSVNTYDESAKVTIKEGQPGTQSQFKALEVQNTDSEPVLRVFNDGKIVVGKGAYANTGETPIFLIQNENQQIFKVNNDGIVWAREIKLTLDVFPDYVFNQDYQLMTIEGLSEFISVHGHLPNVPEESEILQDGLNVAKLISTQMEKIEELTLYIIQLNERINELEGQNPQK